MKIKCEGEAIDIPTMHGLSDNEYRSHITEGGGDGFYVDHHDVLRDSVTARPLATTREQFDILMGELSRLRDRMTPRK